MSSSGGPIRSRRSGRLAAKVSAGTASSAKGGGTSSAPKLHHPQHKMHLAIERSITNFEDVQKLLDNGETFCRGDGRNCFVLAVCKRTQNAAKRWAVLMKMLQVDPRGLHVRDHNGKTLLNHFRENVDEMKQLIDMGANLNNVDIAGKNLMQSVFSPHVYETSTSMYQKYCNITYTHNFLRVWDMLMEYKEVQKQVKGVFFKELVLHAEKYFLARKLFCNLIKRGIMSVQELTTKFKMHPLFFIIQLEFRESVELLHYIWQDDPDKNKNVSAIGADLNILDNNGKSLLECVFSHGNLLFWYKDTFALKIWKLLIKHKEIQSQASKDGFLRGLVPLARNSDLVKDIFLSAFQLGIWSVEKLTLELQMHPLFFLVELAEGEASCFLRLMKSNPSFFEDKTILITINTRKLDYYDGNYPCWQKAKDLLNIPKLMTFDVFGQILFSLQLSCFTRNSEAENVKRTENIALFESLTFLLEQGFVPSSAAGVVHPIHALLYNFIVNAQKKIYIGGSYCSDVSKNLPNILQKTITIFKDFPVPHKLVEDPDSGSLMLDVHLLISSIICPATVENSKANETLFELIMMVVQLSPCHPLKLFATFYKYSSCYFQNRNNRNFLEPFCKLLRLTLEASGSHGFQGVDQQTIKCISSFCESVNNFQMPYEPEEITLHKKAAVKAESEVSSLQWMCILQIRKTLFLSRSSTTLTLPSLIRGLAAEGRIPQGLEADLLVYKPNSSINF